MKLYFPTWDVAGHSQRHEQALSLQEGSAWQKRVLAHTGTSLFSLVFPGASSCSMHLFWYYCSRNSRVLVSWFSTFDLDSLRLLCQSHWRWCFLKWCKSRLDTGRKTSRRMKGNAYHCLFSQLFVAPLSSDTYLCFPGTVTWLFTCVSATHSATWTLTHL